MSDEEDLEDGKSFKVKTPVKLSKLIREMDMRKENDNNLQGKQVLRKLRKPSDSPMKRKPSKRVSLCHLEVEEDDDVDDDDEETSDENIY